MKLTITGPGDSIWSQDLSPDLDIATLKMLSALDLNLGTSIIIPISSSFSCFHRLQQHGFYCKWTAAAGRLDENRGDRAEGRRHDYGNAGKFSQQS